MTDALIFNSATEYGTGLDSPMFRTRVRSLVAPVGTPIYHKDVNADWRIDGQPLTVLDTNATKRKIANTLIVLVGEEPFEPHYGSLITWRVFENITDRTSYLVEGDTIDALSNFMSDEITVNHQQCRVTPLYDDDGYFIQLVYQELAGGAAEGWAFNLTRTMLGA